MYHLPKHCYEPGILQVQYLEVVFFDGSGFFQHPATLQTLIWNGLRNMMKSSKLHNSSDLNMIEIPQGTFRGLVEPMPQWV